MPRTTGSVNVMVLRAAGTNCDVETQHALELLGAQVQRVHINRLIADPAMLESYQMLVVPGGFSYGDDVAAGKILANQMIQHLSEPLHAFVEQGKLLLGICNGFQVLIKAGLLPGGTRLRNAATLTLNDNGKFEDRWVHLLAASDKCVFLKRGQQMYLPVAHAEGKFVVRDGAVSEALVDCDQVALRYVDEAGQPGSYPVNPNGSVDDVAGLCDASGRVLGLMPHPERFVHPTQHPHWTRLEALPEPDGSSLFQSAIRYIKSNL